LSEPDFLSVTCFTCHTTFRVRALSFAVFFCSKFRCDVTDFNLHYEKALVYLLLSINKYFCTSIILLLQFQLTEH